MSQENEKIFALMKDEDIPGVAPDKLDRNRYLEIHDHDEALL